MPPEPSPRAVAYVRESTEEQGQGFSPDAQREAIRSTIVAVKPRIPFLRYFQTVWGCHEGGFQGPR